MAHSYVDAGGFGDFDVVITNPSSTIVRFAVEDAANRLTDVRLIRAVICQAITQWLEDVRANLDANGDTAVVGATENYPGDGFGAFDFNFGGKFAQVTLISTYGIEASDTQVVAIPYADIC